MFMLDINYGWSKNDFHRDNQLSYILIYELYEIIINYADAYIY
jgi:hypothetical protein